VSKIRIADKILAIKFDTQLAGDEPSPSTADDELAALIRRVTEQPWPRVQPATPKTSPDTQTPGPTGGAFRSWPLGGIDLRNA
jgi:hypothetical protein